MSSGCILGNCKYCNNIIWEDEIYEIENDMTIYHKNCADVYKYVDVLQNENKKLKQEISILKNKLFYEALRVKF